MKAIAVCPVSCLSSSAALRAAGRPRRRQPAYLVRFAGLSSRARENPRFPRGSEVSAL